MTGDLLERIGSVAPAGRQRLDRTVQGTLRALTAELLRARPDSALEFDRYLAVRYRELELPHDRVADAVRGRSVLVTGGTGCVGTALLHRLADLGPAKLVGVGITAPDRAVPGVGYAHVDVRSTAEVDDAFARHRPDLVFHLAAQRDPGLAERRVADTVGTNLLGTANVVASAERAGVERLVYASTGKAVRPYTTDVYAGSKRVGEWLLGQAAARGRLRCSGVRFTHVVDNAILLDRLRHWAAADEPVRLHCADTMFYVQSAAESAQLLLTALLAPQDRRFRLHVLRDLGWPVGLLDVALGFMTRHGRVLPVHLAGHDPGYEAAAYPGLYDPMLAGDTSPLVNAIEAHDVEPTAVDGTDAFAVRPVDAPAVAAQLPDLYRRCRAGDDESVRVEFRRIAWELFRATADSTSPAILARLVRLTRRHRATMSAEHRRVDDVLRHAAPRGERSGHERSGQELEDREAAAAVAVSQRSPHDESTVRPDPQHGALRVVAGDGVQ